MLLCLHVSFSYQDDSWVERKSPVGAEAGDEQDKKSEDAGEVKEEEEEDIPKDNPMFVPRGRFFHHDDRNCEEEGDQTPR